MNCPYCKYREDDIIFINHKVVEVRDVAYIISCFRCTRRWAVGKRSTDKHTLNMGEDYPKGMGKRTWWAI